MKKFLISIFTISALLISACSNMSDGILESPVWNEADSATVSAGDSNQNCVTVTGSVGFSGAYPQELVNQDSSAASARTAFPSVSDLSNYDYDITATSGSVTYTGTAAENGKTYQVTIPVTSTPTSYKVQIKAKTKDSTPKTVLEGVSESFSIGPESQTAIADVVLSASSKTTEKGGIKLTVTLGSDSGITSGILAIEGMDDIPGTLSGSTITFKTDNESKITCGAHKARFTFLNGSEASTSDEIYSFTQIVHVFQNLYTDAWVQNGAEPYFTTTTSGDKKTTTCQITKTMVDSYQLTEIYVDPTTADDNGSGTFIHPKKNF